MDGLLEASPAGERESNREEVGSLSEKFTHLSSAARRRRIGLIPQVRGESAAGALVLIHRGRLISLLCLRADDEGSDVTSAIGRIVCLRLIENNNQQTILLKCRTGNQRGDVLLQPCVGELKRPVVSIVQKIRRQKGKTRKLVIGQVGIELRQRHQIVHLGAAVHHIGKVGETDYGACYTDRHRFPCTR